MKQQEAEKLLNDTFSNEFNSSKYVHFLNELLKGKISIQDKSLGVNKEFEEYIKSLKKIGEYKNGRNNVELFAVELKRVSSLERARTMQRNFVAKWLHNEFLPKDAALVAFYGENPEDWRFSFVKMEYKMGEDGKILKELTPAKRYSFLVGKNEPNHTCKSQFLKLLTEDDIPPTLEELEGAFGVENVTKIFFEEYKNRFFELRESIEKVLEKNSIVKKEFENKNINPTEFAKKLLGQIVFLYFLQKKGWLGVKKDGDGKFNEWGTGPKDFMKKLFNKEIVNYDNFFNDVLEPLFYQALANDRSVDNDYYEKLKCKVPFLNGGLFEPIKDYDWTKTDILLGNDIFKDIFSTFDKFNFTIKEDEPLEREVAVDPEMLGKVFENLLDVQDRKSKGAFYTPREIVHYMCQQSLINYLETNTAPLGIKREDIEMFILKGDRALDTLRRIQLGKWDDVKLILPKSITSNFKELDRLLREIKICDPAVGSGAFPVGMMNEIVRARNILSYFFLLSEIAERTDYNLKRQTIENSLYGVDIESSAVEITKLRFWLSLIVDELDMKNIRPLPNLDNRIMCGNSLIEEFEGVKLFDEDLLTGIHTKKEEKQSALDKFTENKRKESEVKLNKLISLQKEYFNEQDRNKKKRLMKEIENLEWEFIETTLKEQGNEEAIKKLEQYKNSKSKPFFLWKLYFSDVFQRENPGFDVVIANPPYVNIANLSEEHRLQYKEKFTVTKNKVDLYAYFIELGNIILRRKGSLTYIVPHTWKATSSFESLRKLIFTNFQMIELVELTDKTFEATVKPVVIVLKKEIVPNYSIAILNDSFENINKISIKEILASGDYSLDTLSSDKDKNLFLKIENKSIPLEKVLKFTRGIKTSDDKRFVSDKPFKEESYPLIRGRDVSKWRYVLNGEYIWYKPNLMREKVGCLPHTKNLFEVKKKLILQRISKGIVACFDDKQIFSLDTTLVSVNTTLKSSIKLEYLLGLFNSKLINFWYGKKFILPTVSGYELHQIPIKDILEKDQKPLVDVVNRILSITNEEDYQKNLEKHALIQALEKKIDKIVYELYELTPEEIKIVEEFGKEK